MLAVDQELRIVRISLLAAKMLGADPQDALGAQLGRFCAEESPIYLAVLRALKGEAATGSLGPAGKEKIFSATVRRFDTPGAIVELIFSPSDSLGDGEHDLKLPRSGILLCGLGGEDMTLEQIQLTRTRAAERLRQSLRATDSVSMLAGGEVAAILAGATKRILARRANDLLEALESEVASSRLQVAFGTAIMAPTEGLDDALSRARQALAAARMLGPGKIVSAEELPDRW